MSYFYFLFFSIEPFCSKQKKSNFFSSKKNEFKKWTVKVFNYYIF